MNSTIRSLLLAILLIVGATLADQPLPVGGPPPRPAAKAPPVVATLVTDVKAVRPGQDFRVGVLLAIPSGWHIYWKIPGQAGMATSVDLKLPKGFRAGPLRWPRPETFTLAGGVISYGYSGSVLLWATVTPPPDLKPGSEIALGAKVAWLACDADRCVPASSILAQTLAATDKPSPAPAPEQKLFADWAARTDPPAPAFTLSDQDSKPVRLADFAGKVVVLEWINPDCPFVQYHHRPDVNTMGKLAQAFKDKGVVWLAVNSSHYWTNEKARAYRAEAKLAYPILDDHLGIVGRAYAAKATPHMFVIDQGGLIVYQGAIDNAPMGKTAGGAAPVNHVQAAVEELLAGKPVTVPRTNAYGCSVKYAAK